jgi:hypothetical protein
MSTPAPGRKLSTADLATPSTRTDVNRPDTGEGPEPNVIERVFSPPEARRTPTDDAGQPMPPLDAGTRPESAPPAVIDARPEDRAEGRTDIRTDAPRPDRTTADEEVSALFADDECHALWKRWDDIQAGFVDEPRRAVQDADSLVAETMQQLANTFARERSNLEGQWGRGDNVSTEDLRLAFRRYRSFFKRLLSV